MPTAARPMAQRYVGIPGQAVPEPVRSAVERAWFEQCPLQLTYRDRDGVVTERRVRIRRVLMDRGETRLQCDELDKGAARELVLHRVEAAAVDVG